MITSRENVYAALDSERSYQIFRWDESNNKHNHTIEEWITYIEDYLAEAKHILSREDWPGCDEKTIHIIRKVTAMGVACMEQRGAPRREGY